MVAMKVNILLVVAVAIIYGIANVSAAPKPRDEEDGLYLAEPCDPDVCHPPQCRCSSTVLDDKIPVDQTPQLVMLTFDDAVTASNYHYIEQILYGRSNPDGCPSAATFFVSHEYTDYSKVHQLWADGHEIALHSITHTPHTTFWKTASVETLIEEFDGEREMIAHFANIDINDIKGIRVPHLQLSGNNSFEAIRQMGLTYDCTWPTQHFVDPGMWPFTLDYASRMDCPLGDCPTASIPGVWVAPMLDWEDVEGYKCAMVDACQYLPPDDVEEMYNWMVKNFERSYHSNRAPFGVFIHTAWFLTRKSHFDAYLKFVHYLNSLDDVYLVSVSKVIEFTRNPRAVTGTHAVPPVLKPEPEPEQTPDALDGRAAFDSCQALHTPTCASRVCQLTKESTGEERWMTSCAACPAVYPWLGNPFGEREKHRN